MIASICLIINELIIQNVQINIFLICIQIK